jgi:hypothetical protein
MSRWTFGTMLLLQMANRGCQWDITPKLDRASALAPFGPKSACLKTRACMAKRHWGSGPNFHLLSSNLGFAPHPLRRRSKPRHRRSQ